jgi:hypothetical protein
MNKSIIALAVGLSLSIGFASVAFAGVQNCKELSKRAKSYAKSRDEGYSLDSLTSSIDVVAEMNNLPEGEKMVSEQIALWVYTRFKDLSPEQTQKQFYLDCVSASR